MQIRSANESDAEALAHLSTQLGYPSSPEQAQRRIALIRQRNDHEILVGEIEGVVVAWVHVFGTDRLETDPYVEIGGLVVDASQRRRGLGAQLLDAAEEWALLRGYETIRLRSNIVRTDAHRFYDRRGYECFKRQAVFSKSLHLKQ